MATIRKQVILRMTEAERARITESARTVGMTVNRYMLQCALARGHDSEQDARLRASLKEHRDAVDERLAEVAAWLETALTSAQAKHAEDFGKLATYLTTKLGGGAK